jgi:hypothetical protein
MDLRDQENICDKWYDSFDSKTMQFTVHKECECDGGCEEITNDLQEAIYYSAREREYEMKYGY